MDTRSHISARCLLLGARSPSTTKNDVEEVEEGRIVVLLLLARLLLRRW
jgi:hypothetical protein